MSALTYEEKFTPTTDEVAERLRKLARERLKK